ncbi:flagellar biosynthesis anti-sigma factor FlgM [Paenibacillus aceris]|uniref:Negative regulator of flagellin synthesis n=1 Tax=Paenibacillus aceris TaxID=869555 RepID=A0ABS4I5V7_9BACL|nr:flagellar biosynthesis anti-sigma factor FlgM [Paenibacillus aceris]MBP1965796.1 negative regulator of flagellin synthesis FlgM [Paenibacillus aceris]NHW34858.1 flagellar biosynthesis anti-sigma factor FlgM [Paenibacillus aceris]
MKINENQRIGNINKYIQSNENRSVNGTEKKKRKDEVQISAEAKELLENASAVRSNEQKQRIQELKESVSAGTYHVEARKIAEKLFPYIK